MLRLLQLARAIDRLTAAIGRWVSWAIVASILVSAVNAIVRKLFDMSSNAWLEAQWYLFGLTFMLASAWTLQRREHIRIDIVSNRLPKSVRHSIELIGHLVFLLPFVTLMVILGWAIFGRSVVNDSVAWHDAGGFFGELSLVLDRLSAGIGTSLTGGRGQWEHSGNTEGLPLWPAYLFILVGFALLFLQGLAETIKHMAVMRGLLPEPSGSGGHGGTVSEPPPAVERAGG